MQFAIWAPDYNDRSAGIAALHRLCHWLNVLGHDAGVTAHGLNRDWEAKVWLSPMTPDVVAVYPEIIDGNPFGASRIARWALSHPGYPYFGSPARWQTCEHGFFYAERFHAAAESARGGPVSRLHVNVMPSDMFFDGAFPRNSDMYYVGRGQNVFDAFRDRVDLSNAMPWPGNFPNRHEVAKALRRTRRFFVFDQVGGILAEAMLCGCEVYFVRDDGTVIRCERDGVENMGVFQPHSRFDQPGDVVDFVKAFA